ncbi:MAG: hypothetical protein R2822_25315 [Spirosomataceae bacterium]
MEEQLKVLLYDPQIGKIVTILMGIAVVWVFIKTLQKRLFSKIKENDHRYRANKFKAISSAIY